MPHRTGAKIRDGRRRSDRPQGLREERSLTALAQAYEAALGAKELSQKKPVSDEEAVAVLKARLDMSETQRTALEVQRKSLLEENANLRDLLSVDPQTRLLKPLGLRDAYQKVHADLVQKGVNANSCVHVGFFDGDGMKRLNDTYGYEETDKIVTFLAQSISKQCRPTDFIARIYQTGDELYFLATEVGRRTGQKGPTVSMERHAQNIQDQKNFIKRLLRKVEKLEFPGHPGLRVTISAGMATVVGIDDSFEVFWHQIERYFKRAEEAMRLAKKKGKNTVVIYEEEFGLSEEV
ncbi:MAG: GGDEF domain-containing protein [Candidatus Moraniibacteriota bacterium]